MNYNIHIIKYHADQISHKHMLRIHAHICTYLRWKTKSATTITKDNSSKRGLDLTVGHVSHKTLVQLSHEGYIKNVEIYNGDPSIFLLLNEATTRIKVQKIEWNNLFYSTKVMHSIHSLFFLQFLQMHCALVNYWLVFD